MITADPDLAPALGLCKDQEGFVSTLRKDTRGNLFLGYGFTPQKSGITKRAAEYLLIGQIEDIRDQLSTYYWWPKLNPVRVAVIVSMVLNNGVHGLLGFPKMLTAVANEDWKEAAAQIRDSDDYRSDDLHDRYEALAQMMELGITNVATT